MLDVRLAEIAGSEACSSQVASPTGFRGISTLTALGLIAEIGDRKAGTPNSTPPVRARTAHGDGDSYRIKARAEDARSLDQASSPSSD